MPSYAELAKYRDSQAEEFARWFEAVALMYSSTDAEFRAVVDQTPRLLMDCRTTYAALLGLGYGERAIRHKVIAKMVELRLSS